MSVVGIDLGTQSTKVGVARNKGIDIITNEVSNRSTPTLVGFGPRSRYIGETAKTQETSNLRNTVTAFKRLLGRSFDDPDVQIEQEFNSATLCNINGEAGAEVAFLGKEEKFTATQLAAMFLGKIKRTTSNETRLPVSDVVISVPAWFTDTQRRSLLDAADLVGLKALRLINDTTAIALGYGITKVDLPTADEKPRRLVFLDIGHSDYTCSVVEYHRGELNIKATAYDRHFGGRNFDKALVSTLAKDFKEIYHIDVTTNPKAYSRVYAAAERMKKVLSANAVAPLNIESVMNDIDVHTIVKRDAFEESIKPYLDRVTAPIEQALAEAKLKPEDIDFIEMVGGCTRVPAVKDRVTKFFGKNLSFTLNQDEAVARGCAFSCAILSPSFRVRDFSVHDIVNYPIEFTWEQTPEVPDEDTSLTVFNKGNIMPSTKILTFYRRQPFELEAKYSNPEQLPGGANPFIGRFSVQNVKADDKDDFMMCKLKARLNLHGILNIESGYYVEDVEVEEPIPEESKEGEAKEDEADTGKPKTRKVKKQVRKGDLPVFSRTSGYEDSVKHALAEQENSMFMADKLVADTEDKKNELEANIYELRGKIDDVYAEYASEEEKSKLKAKLEQSEDWLYEEGDDTTKAAYTAKLDEIRFIAGPIIQRHVDKIEAEKQAKRQAEEEALAKKRADIEAKVKAEQEAKKAQEETAANAKDTEMKDSGEEAPKNDNMEVE